MAATKVILALEALSFPFSTPDPFLFAVHHKDFYPAGDDKMQAPRRGNGADFNPNSAYRMYHGGRVPGFPQHPHRGFETLTATIEGTIDHADSMGNAGRYGGGDLQWMTAGKGIVHGEMFPLIHSDKPNTLHLFQIWLNLRAQDKMVDPYFTMHWAEKIPHLRTNDGLTEVTVWAGELDGAQPLEPPPASYAAVDNSEVAVWFLRMKPGGMYTLPPATGGSSINRSIYWFHGPSASIGGQKLDKHYRVDVDASKSCICAYPNSSSSTNGNNDDGDNETYFLVLQGRPIGEPVVQHGPFVMNTQQEIMQAFQDYQRTQFGGWPWPKDGYTHDRSKGRFALLNGTEMYPPSVENESKSESPSTIKTAAKTTTKTENTRVVLHGLKSESMNGKTGIKGSFDKEKERYQVRLDSTGKTVLVKAENIRDVEL